MIARVIVQINAEGEQHVTFTQDRVTPVEEFLIDSPGWKDSQVVSGEVLLMSTDSRNDHVEALLDSELHTASSIHPTIVIDKAVERLLSHVLK